MNVFGALLDLGTRLRKWWYLIMRVDRALLHWADRDIIGLGMRTDVVDKVTVCLVGLLDLGIKLRRITFILEGCWSAVLVV